MNRLTDMTLATQFSTVIAGVCTYLAHLIEAGHILNPNWNFAVYVLLVIAMVFMILPYLIVDHEVKQVTEELAYDVVEHIATKPVKPIH